MSMFRRIAALGSLVAPPLCLACGRESIPTGRLCEQCEVELQALFPGARLVDPFGPVSDMFSIYRYEGPARAIIKTFKFSGGVGLAQQIAERIADRAPAGLLDAVTIIPVPLHPAHRRSRGYNQTALMATALAAATGLPVCDCLERSGSARPQHAAARGERLGLDQSAFAVNLKQHSADLRQTRRSALLLDDVVTTGATLKGCAVVLRRFGIRQVYGMTFASTNVRTTSINRG